LSEFAAAEELKAAGHLCDLERAAALVVPVAEIPDERSRFRSVGQIRHLGQFTQREGLACQKQHGFQAAATGQGARGQVG
jgi:hypothetical protein